LPARLPAEPKAIAFRL